MTNVVLEATKSIIKSILGKKSMGTFNVNQGAIPKQRKFDTHINPPRARIEKQDLRILARRARRRPNSRGIDHA